jgi:hypothetical protein
MARFLPSKTQSDERGKPVSINKIAFLSIAENAYAMQRAPQKIQTAGTDEGATYCAVADFLQLLGLQADAPNIP